MDSATSWENLWGRATSAPVYCCAFVEVNNGINHRDAPSRKRHPEHDRLLICRNLGPSLAQQGIIAPKRLFDGNFQPCPPPTHDTKKYYLFVAALEESRWRKTRRPHRNSIQLNPYSKTSMCTEAKRTYRISSVHRCLCGGGGGWGQGHVTLQKSQLGLHLYQFLVILS